MLSSRAPSTHNTLSLPSHTASASELSPASMKQSSVQVAGTVDSFSSPAPKFVKCIIAVTEECMIQWGEGGCVRFLYTLG